MKEAIQTFLKHVAHYFSFAHKVEKDTKIAAEVTEQSKLSIADAEAALIRARQDASTTALAQAEQIKQDVNTLNDEDRAAETAFQDDVKERRIATAARLRELRRLMREARQSLNAKVNTLTEQRTAEHAALAKVVDAAEAEEKRQRQNAVDFVGGAAEETQEDNGPEQN